MANSSISYRLILVKTFSKSEEKVFWRSLKDSVSGGKQKRDETRGTSWHKRTGEDHRAHTTRERSLPSSWHVQTQTGSVKLSQLAGGCRLGSHQRTARGPRPDSLAASDPDLNFNFDKNKEKMMFSLCCGRKRSPSGLRSVWPAVSRCSPPPSPPAAARCWSPR